MNEYQQYAYEKPLARADRITGKHIRPMPGGWAVGLSVNY